MSSIITSMFESGTTLTSFIESSEFWSLLLVAFVSYVKTKKHRAHERYVIAQWMTGIVFFVMLAYAAFYHQSLSSIVVVLRIVLLTAVLHGLNFLVMATINATYKHCLHSWHKMKSKLRDNQLEREERRRQQEQIRREQNQQIAELTDKLMQYEQEPTPPPSKEEQLKVRVQGIREQYEAELKVAEMMGFDPESTEAKELVNQANQKLFRRLYEQLQ